MVQKTDKEQALYKSSTPRWMENAHIFLWLIKDACWAMFWKPGGIFMIFPTIGVALYLLWKSRQSRAEFVHNLAICLWISANSVWMLSEFFGVEKQYKQYSIYLFIIGIVVLLGYYILFFRKDREKEKQYAVSN